MEKNKKASVIKVGDSAVVLEAFDIDTYICLTDLARAKGGAANAAEMLKNWVKNPETIAFLGAWERMYNPDFKETGLERFQARASLPKSLLDAGQWIEETGAIGLYVKIGRSGGVYAHPDIAFEFGCAISPVFRLYVMKEYQRAKEAAEQDKQAWDAKGFLSRVTLTGAVKKYAAPKNHDQEEGAWMETADEADLLELAVFGCTDEGWRRANPGLAARGGLRDFASATELTVLLTLEKRNGEFKKEGKPKEERLKALRGIAAYQMKALNEEKSVLE